LIDSSQENRLFNAMEMLELVLPKKSQEILIIYLTLRWNRIINEKAYTCRMYSKMVKQIVFKKRSPFSTVEQSGMYVQQLEKQFIRSTCLY